MYIDDSIRKYLSDLAAKKPAPGGGSAASLCGAAGTALLEMVCNFTLGNERYKDVQADIRKHVSALTKIRQGFEALVDEDVKAYSSIRDAFKSKDKKNIDNALKSGYDICLKICRLSKDGLDIASELPGKGNPNLITDVGCGTELLNAAFNSGVFNCEINLKGIEDKNFANKEKERLEDLKKDIGLLYRACIAKTKERMK